MYPKLPNHIRVFWQDEKIYSSKQYCETPYTIEGQRNYSTLKRDPELLSPLPSLFYFWLRLFLLLIDQRQGPLCHPHYAILERQLLRRKNRFFVQFPGCWVECNVGRLHQNHMFLGGFESLLHRQFLLKT